MSLRGKIDDGDIVYFVAVGVAVRVAVAVAVGVASGEAATPTGRSRSTAARAS